MNTKEYNRQKYIDSKDKSKINEKLANKISAESTAKDIAGLIYAEVLKFQNELPESEDVVLNVSIHGMTSTVLVEKIGHIGYTLVSFHGKDSSDKDVEIVQHISQINIQLAVVPSEKPQMQHRKIGFCTDQT